MNMQETRLLAALDIGTTKISCLIAEVNAENEINIIGVGQHESNGLNRGNISDFQKTVNSIAKAIYEAEASANAEVGSLLVTISGDHFQYLESAYQIAITSQFEKESGSKKEIRQQDIIRLTNDLKGTTGATDKEILHTIPLDYSVDKQNGIENPVGLRGTLLGIKANLITIESAVADNIVRAIREANVELSAFVLDSLATSKVVLTEEEKEMGVILLDIGGQISNLAIFEKGKLVHVSSIRMGAFNLTKDIAYVLRLSVPVAESLKLRYGQALVISEEEDNEISAEGLAGQGLQKISRHYFLRIINARMREILNLAFHDANGYLTKKKVIPTNLVITGGGAKLPQIDQLAQEIFGMPVRIGNPIVNSFVGRIDSVSDPAHATVLGLLNYGVEHFYTQGFRRENDAKNKGLSKFKKFLENFF